MVIAVQDAMTKTQAEVLKEWRDHPMLKTREKLFDVIKINPGVKGFTPQIKS
jgi:hypothetical protein